MPKYDAIIVGSGLAGVHAAVPLVEQGLTVALLDVGHTESKTKEEDGRTFEEVRKSDPKQHELFLGEDFSGIGLGEGHARAMVSGRRSFVTQGSLEYAPLFSGEARVLQSFAQGGLSAAWSGICDVYDSQELDAVGLPAKHMRKHYEAVIRRIGVSGVSDDFSLQMPPTMDDAAREILRRYRSRKEHVARHGIAIEQPMYAMLTEKREGRTPVAYRDMDFWDNNGRAMYRASHTLEELQRNRNFSYIGDMLALSIENPRKDGDVVVVTRNVKSHVTTRYVGKSLVLAAGSVNTTRILMRSFGHYDTPAPIIMKNHYIVPCLFPAQLGKRPDPRRHSLTQLAMHGLSRIDGMRDLYAQILSYNSLLLYKLLHYMPLPVPEAFSLLSVLTPALIFVDIRFPSSMDERHKVILRKRGDGDTLEIAYPEDAGTKRTQEHIVRKAKRALRGLGLFPLTEAREAYGTTSQYAGGVPIGEETMGRLTVKQSGQLHGHERIFVADSASWRALPAKPSGLTIMANANRVGSEVARFLST